MNPDRLLTHFERLADTPDAMPRVRRFILDLAVRGKLVEQDRNDEPASELLKRIEGEKARLSKVGRTRRQATLPKVDLDDQPFELPGTWAWSRFGSIVDFVAGRTPSRHETSFWNTGEYPWVSIADMKDGGAIIATKETVSERAKVEVFRSAPHPIGTLLMSFKLTIGKISRLEVPAFHNEAIISIFPKAPQVDSYLFLILPLFAQQGITKKAIKGATLNRESLGNLLIPLPPLAEQHRIVAKVHELMALCDRLEASRNERESRRYRLVAASLHRLNRPAEEDGVDTFRANAHFYFNQLPRLTTRPDHIKQLRQTILNLAVRGKLVERDPADEPVPSLLGRLAAARNRLETDGTIRPLKAFKAVEEAPFDIPEPWSWCRLTQVCDVVDPNPSHRMPTYVSEGGLPFISSENFADGDTIDLGIGKRVTQATVTEQMNRFPILDGAFGFSRIGTIGKTRPLPQSRDYAISHAVCVINPLSLDDLSMRYLRLAMAVDGILAHAHGGTRSIGVPDLGMGVIRTLAIPLPPLAEQRRIVAKVDELMALCDRLEASLARTEADSRRLLEAVLHEALSPVDELTLAAAS